MRIFSCSQKAYLNFSNSHYKIKYHLFLLFDCFCLFRDIKMGYVRSINVLKLYTKSIFAVLVRQTISGKMKYILHRKSINKKNTGSKTDKVR